MGSREEEVIRLELALDQERKARQEAEVRAGKHVQAYKELHMRYADLTQIKNKENILLPSFLDKLQSGLLVLAEDNRILFINKAFCTLFNLPGSITDYTGSPILELPVEAHLLPLFPINTAHKDEEMTREFKLPNQQVIEREVIGDFIINSQVGLACIFHEVTEKHQKISEIREKKEFIQQVIDTSPNLVDVRDAAGNFVLVNNAFSRFVAQDKLELLGSTWADTAFCTKDVEALKSCDQLVIEKKEESRQQIQITTSNGHTIDLLSIKNPLVTANGEVYILSILIDITEQKERENQLTEQEELYRLLSENSRDLIGLHDLEWNFLFVSKALENMLGYKYQDVWQTTPLDYVHPDDLLVVKENFNNTLKGLQKRESIEYRMRRKDGIYIWVETTVKPVLEEKESLIKYHSITRDITEQKEAREAIKRSEKNYKDLIKYSQTYIVKHDLQGTIHSVNLQLLKTLGYKEEEVLGRHLSDFLSARQSKRLHAYLEEADRANCIEGVFELIDKDKNKRSLMYKSNVVEESNSVPYVIFNAQDITERVEAEKELEKAKVLAEDSVRLKENFLANMSHEIRTPMNGILGITHLLSNTVLDGEQQKFVEIIQQSSNHLLIIINDILDFGKVNAGKLEIEHIPFNLNEVIKDAYQAQVFKAEEKDIAFQADFLPEEDTMLIGDPYRLKQVLLNLMNNAIKFTNEGGVKLKTQILKQDAGRLTLSFCVTDSGIGIPEEKQQLIFEEFTQSYSNTTRKYGGTGLGLSICKSLIEMQGGRIWLESQEGKGSCFKFEITYEKCTDELPEPTSQTIDYKSLGKVRVLLAEDNEVNIMLAKALMKRWGFNVQVAYNGLEAVQSIKKNDYDIVLMDIQMPELNGLEATERIRSMADPKKANVPIIALTANAIKSDAEKYLNSGMDDYVSKPFTEEKLFTTIAHVLADKQQINESNATVAVQKAQQLKEQEPQLNEKHCDLTYLHQMVDGDKEYMSEIINIYLEQSPGELEEMGSAIEASEWSVIQKTTHKLKSSVALLGAEKERAALEEMEILAKKEEALQQIKALYQELMEAQHIIKRELKQFLDA